MWPKVKFTAYCIIFRLQLFNVVWNINFNNAAMDYLWIVKFFPGE